MATIVIHAGMGKAGSSTIQRWLHDNSSMLRERGFTVLTAPENDRGDIEFAPHDGGTVNISWIARQVDADPARAEETAVRAARALARAAEQHGDVVISSETFARPFYSLHSPTLRALRQLCHRHRVRVAYYARPQDSRLEASWRQIGFRTPLAPSTYIERRAPILHYAATLDGVRSIAPELEFELRPFHPDLLDGGDVVSDFAGRFLGVEAEAKVWVNKGLPLEVVNILHAAPAGMFWHRSYGNRRVKRIKRLLARHPIPDDERIAYSRQVLRKYAHERYGRENDDLGWVDFVPPPDDPVGTPPLEALDELWAPRASPGELALLFRALEVALGERLENEIRTQG